MAQIQPVSVWKDGQVKTAEQLSLRSIGDDLESSAQFYYELKEADVTTQDAEGNDVTSYGQSLANGNLSMSGQSYSDWGAQAGSDINAWAYDWAAEQLNVVIV
jgi:hypothetical protein